MHLQIQSIIYHNDINGLEKAIKGLKQAVHILKTIYNDFDVTFTYGDASSKPIFNEKKINYVNRILDNQIEFKYVFFNENTGTSKGHNILANKSEADYILIMNPDVILEPRCLLRMYESMKKNEHAAMVEARQVPIEHPKDYDMKTGECDWATTACALIDYSAFKEVNGFDESSFFMYCDDLDFSWQLRLAGYKIIYDASALVFHSKRLTLTGNWMPTSAEVYYSAEAALILAYKWSRQDLAESLYLQYKQSQVVEEQKAAAEYEKRKKAGNLPHPVDGNHKIGSFVNGNYGAMRFDFN